MSINPVSSNAFGVMMLNSSPIEVLVTEESLTYKMTSGIIELYIFGGPHPNEVIIQLQQTVGMPILPPYYALNWQSSLILSSTTDHCEEITNYLDILLEKNSFPINCNYYDLN